jgi:hypothetical protein
MKRKIVSILAGLALVGVGIFAVQSPAAASSPFCPTPPYHFNFGTASGGSIGEVSTCLNGYNGVTLAGYGSGDMQFLVHDWTNDGHNVYVEYMAWDSTVWNSVPGSSDAYGGPATSSDVVLFSTLPLPAQGVKFVRMHLAGTGSFSYIFKSVDAGGCGLEGYVAGCFY